MLKERKMPRPILKTNNINKFSFELNQKSENKNKNRLRIDIEEYNFMLRKKRSPKYVEDFSSLDIEGLENDQAKIKELIAEIHKELPELKLYEASILLGIISKCYLGYPYEVHILDIGQNIIEHYKINEKLPEGMEKARNLAMNQAYKFIEVYSDCCRAVSRNGQVSVVFG